MTKRINQIISYIIPLFFLPMSGCFLWEKPIFPVIPDIYEPAIAEKEVIFDSLSQTFNDVVFLTVRFRDGDGDIGFNSSDTTAPSRFQPVINGNINPESFNFLVDVLELKNGEWIPLRAIDAPLDDVISYNGRMFPRFQEGDKVGPIEGTITQEIPFPQLSYAPNTIIKFRVSIKDRGQGYPAPHLSNVVESDTVILNFR
ncbi:MAG: hypothetical protein MUE85_00970 [Microscillaceae bacterium]|jgi:hypothetical protein|nr:hypothetical protein [Microscillaceae bacterium]